MVVLPQEFVKTRYPGYFWNTKDKQLYSIKVTGVLKPIKFSKGGFFNGCTIEPGYRVSVDGVRRTLPLYYLNTLKPVQEHQVVEVAGQK